jgi:hypothetical protein
MQGGGIEALAPSSFGFCCFCRLIDVGGPAGFCPEYSHIRNFRLFCDQKPSMVQASKDPRFPEWEPEDVR